MLSDNRGEILPGKNPSWGEWLDDSTFQTYPDVHVDHEVRFSEAMDTFTLKISKNAHLTLSNYTNEINCHLEESAILKHRGLPQKGRFYLARNARLEHYFISSNNNFTAHIEVFLNQPNACVDWQDGIALEYDQNMDLNIKIDHVASETHSNCVLKSIIKDNGRLKFFCDIFVQKEAKNCIAHQRNLNHILSPQGQITALPRLHIFNRNVEASHGTATQPIPKDVLFYLQSRGLSAQEAEQTYLGSFFGEIYHHE